MSAHVVPIESRRQRQLRQWLLEERGRLLRAAEGQRRELQAAGEDEGLLAHDAADASEASVQGDLAFRLLQLRTEHLAGIEEALDRLDNEEYGRCVDCSREIALPRLRALPFAVRCLACAEEVEVMTSEAAAPWPSHMF